MLHTNLQAIILSAGKSSRFGTDSSKLLAPLCGQEMILYPTKLLHEFGIETTMVTGHQREDIEAVVKKNVSKNIQFIHQTEQRGTGHAILCTKDAWHKDHILIMNGDMPLVTKDIITKLYAKHTETDAAISFVTSYNVDPSITNYGRVIQDGTKIKIVEPSDFKGDQHHHHALNAGIYLIKKDFLLNYCNSIEANENSNEFYLTDLVGIASNARETVSTVNVPFDCVRGVNTLAELWAAEQIKRGSLIQHWMEHGVRFMMPQTTYIDLDVAIGSGTIISAGAQLLRGTRIGEQCVIHPFCVLDNAIIGDNVCIDSHSVIRDSTVHAQAHIGPYAHLRTETEIHEQAHVGNFVEIKKSTLGKETKAKHLSYLGDATVGSNVNIGAGTITCNHDGKNKHETIIQDNAYIGSNSTLIAPLTIENNAFTAAGSTITDNVPKDALAIGRARQVNKDGYAKKLRSPKTEPSEPPTKDVHNNNTVKYSCAVPTTNDSSFSEEL